jgi:hypothetical protein
MLFKGSEAHDGGKLGHTRGLVGESRIRLRQHGWENLDLEDSPRVLGVLTGFLKDVPCELGGPVGRESKRIRVPRVPGAPGFRQRLTESDFSRWSCADLVSLRN